MHEGVLSHQEDRRKKTLCIWSTRLAERAGCIVPESRTAHEAGKADPQLLAPLEARIPTGRWPHIMAPRGWWKLLHDLDTELATFDPSYLLLRAARVDGELLYLTFTMTGSPEFAGLIADAQVTAGSTCEICGRTGAPRARSRTVVCERHRTPTTAAERQFARSAGIPDEWFSPDAEERNLAYLAHSEAADRAHAATHLSETDMADILNVNVCRVHEMFERASLAGAERGGLIAYPRWQALADGRLVPGLAAVLEAAQGMDSRTLEAIMTSADERFEGLSPVQWLTRGSTLEEVTSSLAEWWWM